jgi:glycosyltransferase involved in cell wall biosynthesis
MKALTCDAAAIPTGGALPLRPHILFIASREPSYSRIAILAEALGAAFAVDTITSSSRRYWLRMLIVLSRFFAWAITGRLRRYDAVFVGFFAQPILPFIRLLWRGRLIADGYFSIYDTLVHDKQTASPRSLKAKLARWLDGFMLRTSDLVFTDTNQHVDYFRTSFSRPAANVRRLWVSAQEKVFRPWDAGALDEQGTLEIIFWGSYIPLQGVDTIIRAAALLKNEPVHFTLYGTGQTYAASVNLAAQLGADNVEFHGWKPLDQIRDFAHRAHLTLGIFGTTPKAGRVIPNKLFQALAMGMPIITGDSAAVRELLTDGSDVMCVPRGDAQALATAVKRVRRDYRRAVEIGRRGADTFRATASPRRVAETVAHAVRACLNETM